jgi:ribonuclease HII
MTRGASRITLPTRDAERELHAQGYLHVAGIDEVGRGPLAGPVVAAAVVFPLELTLQQPELAIIRDSKALTARQRERGDVIVRQAALGIGIGEVPAEEIDRIGIAPATRRAMTLALEALPQPPDHLLIDALQLSWRNKPCTAIIKGDMLCTAIAAASIIAKVYRDALMVEMDALYPGYGFAGHKGYGSSGHLQALQELGPTPIHRYSFRPLRPLLEV